MANSVVISTLLDGGSGYQKGRITVIKVDIIADTTAEITGYKIFDASAYGNPTTNQKLYNLRYCLNGFSAALFWGVSGSVSTNLLLPCETDHYSEQEFDNTVSSISNMDIANHDGDIYLSTKNLTAGDIGYLILAIQHSRD
jgi:hypothetical protein